MSPRIRSRRCFSHSCKRPPTGHPWWCTVDSGGKTLVAPVTDQGTAVYAWEADAAWYDPGTRRANFVVAMENPDGPLGGIAVSAGQEFFGRPAHTYRVDGYVIMVYRYNLLTRLADGSEHL